MSYVALYREWRPQNFQNVVGQTHVTRTLLNALQQGRISHAYLFCGPRGTGKTSVAKILAKAVNCSEAQEGEPCNQCVSCRAIVEGSSLDVLEIDAASNRGIDEIRELRERVQYAPSGGRFRVYIIDEVHMLTTEAFNALLKTLEEPPSHVIFVLATTEAHKVPATILSRCQRFDFRRITPAELIERLKLVAEHQQIEISEEAIMAIVRAAEGGLRDALSLLDQCIGFATNAITLEEVNQVLGTVSEEFLRQAIDGLAFNESARLMYLVEEVVNQGKDVRKYVRDLIGYLRDLLIIKLGDTAGQIIAVSDTLREQMCVQADRWSKAQLIELISYFTRVEADMKWAIQPRWVLEAALIGAGTQLQEKSFGDQMAELNRRLEVLEQDSKLKTLETLPARSPGSKESPREIKPIKAGSIPDLFPPETSRLKEGVKSKLPLEPQLDLAQIQAHWKVVMDSLRKKSVALQALLLEAEPVALQGDCLILAFKKGRNFHRQKVDEPANKKAIEEVLTRVFRQTLVVRCTMQEALEDLQEASAPKASEPESPLADPLVKNAVEIFGPERVKIRDNQDN